MARPTASSRRPRRGHSALARLGAVLLLAALLPASAVSATTATGLPKDHGRQALHERSLPLRHKASSTRATPVAVELLPARDLDGLRAAVAAVGGAVTGEVPGHLVQATVDAADLDALDAHPAVRLVRRPLLSAPDGVGDPPPFGAPAHDRRALSTGSVVGEQVQKTGADAWHAAGITGSGVTVGIIDTFSGPRWDQLAASGDVPPRPASFCQVGGQACDAWTVAGPDAVHGNAVAEVIHEMAPDAQLVVAFAATVTDTRAALQFFQSQGVSIVSRSQGAEYDGPGDGTGPWAAVADEAVAAGMLFVNSAGNAAGNAERPGSYWRGQFSDPDADGWLDFAPSDEDLPILCSGALLGFRWSDWGQGAGITDYDIAVYDSRGGPFTPDNRALASSTAENAQTGLPLDTPGYNPSVCTAGDVDYIRVFRFSPGAGTDGDILELFANQTAFGLSVNEHSASQPIADSANPGVLSVGAVDPPFGTEIGAYSSQGPSNDGRILPRISAAACVASASLAPDCFNGTSSATPVVSGAAALLASAGIGGTPAGLAGELTTRTVDRGAPGADTSFGAGELVLGPPGGSGGGSPDPADVAGCGDRWEPNDAPDTAKDFTNGWYIDGVVCHQQDLDAFLLRVEAGGQIQLDLQFSHAAGDLDVDIYFDGRFDAPVATADGSVDGEQLAYTVTESGVHHVVVYGFEGATNAYRLGMLGTPPPNDLVEFAPELLNARGEFLGSNIGATAAEGEPTPEGGVGAVVWHRWTPSADGTVVVSAAGAEAGISPVVAVFDDAGQQIDDGDPAGSIDTSSTTGPVVVQGGRSYLFAVDARSGPEGPLWGSYRLLWERLEGDFGEPLPITDPDDPSGRPPPGGTPSPDPTTDPSDEGRVAGATPVDVAVAVSQRRFPDPTSAPTAARAVLSRDDLFADSLAGAALTATGPLLFTSVDALDPATGSELQRVLPPGTEVLLLGGERALAPAIEQAVRDLGYAPRRLAGASRFETAVAIAGEVAPSGSETAALARADDWADAITGGAWAADRGIPILLAANDDYSAQSRAWIQGAGVERVVLLGGAAALQPAVESAVTADGLTALRAAGADRHGTAVEIARQLWAGTPDGWVLTNLGDASGWAYGLAAAGLSADRDHPLLGSWIDSLPEVTADFLAQRCGTQVTVIGDTSVILADVADSAEC